MISRTGQPPREPHVRLVKRGPGRPQKFGRPSRALTVTLPEDVIERLAAIDVDLGRAIVAAVERKPLRRARATLHAELVSYGSHSVIVVPPVHAFQQLSGVQLVPIGGNRALISLQRPHAIAQLELDIRDLLERGRIGRSERPTFEAVADILRDARRSEEIEIAERSIIVLESKRHRRSQQR